ncbi:GbsR/MarR family transcriptional regulator [Tropicibacter naphthalenivorans]|uniref:MarR family protein n=1 Tax=Tropicibacter naphthalenivorans TaxID=441103 RepID=A0A0P1G488_9RHOB|nr:hypothetical protein [Tropicibacter naphthalenivorans]CUH76629.1 hypothetical protein TRN7648_01037 [Tropicibacter naphthalenivorans]SMC64452.1 hypothetical protein SAMN04488093_102581 [Tropicibacter naphthalenivorans]
MPDDFAPARAAFVDLLARNAERHGLAPIAGRIVALLLFEGAPVPFGRLAQDLGVSRGSISANTRTLEDRGIIERLQPEGSRQVLYAIHKRSQRELLTEMAQHMLDTAAEARAIVATLPKDAAGPAERIEGFATYHSHVAEGLGHVIARLAPENNAPQG